MYDEDLANLEDWLRRLKVEYDIFLNGHRKKPPDELRMKLERLVKQLAEVGDLSFQQRFRYSTLVARYYVYKDLWRRTLMERESAKEEALQQAGTQKETPHATGQASEIRVAISDPATEKESVKELYQGLMDLSQGCQAGGGTIPFDLFLAYLCRQTEELRKKYNCGRVVFTLSVEDAAVRFRAKPERIGSDIQEDVVH